MKSRALILLIVLLGAVPAAGAEPSGRHFIYAQYDFILTFEFTAGKEAILNVVNFTDQTYAFRLEHISLTDEQDQDVKAEKIVIETGNPSDPYRTGAMKILPNSFIGLVLQGKFDSVKQFKSAAVQLGSLRCHLDPVSEPAFNVAAEKINKMNFDSPDVREDFRVLKMEFFGRKEPAVQK